MINMNIETMKQLIENAPTDEIRNAYIESFETMSGWSYETLYMTDEERKANAEMYRIQQDEMHVVEPVMTMSQMG